MPVSREQFVKWLAEAASAAPGERDRQFRAALESGAKSEDPDVRAWSALLADLAARSDYRTLAEAAQPAAHPLRAEPVVGTWPVRFLTAGVAGGIRRILLVERDFEMHVARDDRGLRLRALQLRGGRLVSRTWRAASAEDLKRRDPEAFSLLQRCGGNRRRFRLAGDWGDLADVYDEPAPDAVPFGRAHRYAWASLRCRPDMTELDALVSALDAMHEAMGTAGVGDEGRWRFRLYAWRIENEARPKPDPNAPSPYRHMVRRLPLLAAQKAVAETAWPGELSRKVRAVYDEALGQVEAVIARAGTGVPGADSADFLERLRRTETLARRRAGRLLEARQQRDWDRRRLGIEAAARELASLLRSLPASMGALGLSGERRDRIEALLPGRERPPSGPPVPYVDFDPDRAEEAALEVRDKLRAALTPAQATAWDAEAARSATPFWHDHYLALFDHELEALSELPVPAEADRGLREIILETKEQVQAALDEAEVGVAWSTEFQAKVAKIFKRSRARRSRFIGEEQIKELTDRRFTATTQVTQMETAARSGGPPLGVPLAELGLTDAQRAVVESLIAEAKEEQEGAKAGRPRRVGVMDQFRASLRSRRELRSAVRAVLTPGQREAWDAATRRWYGELTARARATAEKAQRKQAPTAQPSPPVKLPRAHALMHVNLHALREWRIAALESTLDHVDKAGLCDLIEAEERRLNDVRARAEAGQLSAAQLQSDSDANHRALEAAATSLLPADLGREWSERRYTVMREVQALAGPTAVRPNLIGRLDSLALSDAQRKQCEAIVDEVEDRLDRAELAFIEGETDWAAEREARLEIAVAARSRVRAVLTEDQRIALDQEILEERPVA